MKTSEIKKEAEGIINDIFKVMITSENKADWIKWFDFIEKQLQKYIVWENKFIWRKVRSILNNMYWKKFISNNRKFQDLTEDDLDLVTPENLPY